MDQRIKNRWLKALRGKLVGKRYRQGRQALKRDGKFCCLGVLADVQGAKWVEGCPMLDGVENDSRSYLQSGFRAGLRNSTQQVLARMNDAGDDFADIANYIERRVS